MKKGMFFGLLAAVLVLLSTGAANAHFGMLIPSDSMVMPEEERAVHLILAFTHPFEGIGMEMEKPKAFGAYLDGEKTDLTDRLKKTKVMDNTAWEADYPLNRPGVHTLYMEPAPYWEPAEDSFIIHYTKTAVAAFGDEEGWDAEIGLKTEIVPLARPFGLYAGNLFQGIVKLDGKPVPFAEVEVEYYNQDGKTIPETDYMITQIVKADGNGLFSYAPPAPGWWGFAALNSADYTLPQNGQEKAVELGAVIWVRFTEWKTK